jgi:hypothetical protein
MGEATRAFMKMVAREYIRDQLLRADDHLTAQLLNRWWIRLSCSLQKGLANLILSRSFRTLESKTFCLKDKISVNLLGNLV